MPCFIHKKEKRDAGVGFEDYFCFGYGNMLLDRRDD